MKQAIKIKSLVYIFFCDFFEYKMHFLRFVCFAFIICGWFFTVDCEDDLVRSENIINTFRQISSTLEDVISLLENAVTEGKATYTKDELNTLIQ